MSQKIKLNIDLGKNIKKLRLEAGFGVTELAKHMQLLGCEGTTRESLNKIEAGKQNIRLTELRAFIYTFGISYDAFFRFLEEGTNE
ncbi:MAG: helix-turn-helix domain-containing protein [Treponema sp.]|nr:helix-turn-helix domain-containing protein [Treponema sp.]